jgi:hypothetical protein
MTGSAPASAEILDIARESVATARAIRAESRLLIECSHRARADAVQVRQRLRLAPPREPVKSTASQLAPLGHGLDLTEPRALR